MVDRADLSITGEADYMVRRALAGEGRVVTLGALVFFSTATGDAWMLDPADNLALGLARDGRALPTRIMETRERFAVEWTHSYRIDGDVMTFVDGTGRSREISGYPAVEIESAIRRMQSAGR
ncbi:MAG: hypothetical protein MUE73_15355 [Planctomycetes bacterium]|nr:hypothetical protein [Planctomycetota bacterium]